MDLTYHIITGALISQATTNTPANKLILISVLLPDLVGTIPFYFYKLKKNIKEKKLISNLREVILQDKFHGKTDRNAYYATHSLFGIIVFSVLFYIFFKDLAFPMALGYISHVLVDIPTHTGDWSFRPLFPFSTHTIGLGNWWQNRQLSFFMWGILILIATALFF